MPQDVRKNSTIIFDDVSTFNQSIIRDYINFGRHNNTDCFYLCLTYISILKQLIRDNANLLVLFLQDILNLKHIFDDHISFDMSFHQFKDFCSLCLQDKFGFVVVDKDREKNNG